MAAAGALTAVGAAATGAAALAEEAWQARQAGQAGQAAPSPSGSPRGRRSGWGPGCCRSSVYAAAPPSPTPLPLDRCETKRCDDGGLAGSAGLRSSPIPGGSVFSSWYGCVHNRERGTGGRHVRGRDRAGEGGVVTVWPPLTLAGCGVGAAAPWISCQSSGVRQGCPAGVSPGHVGPHGRDAHGEAVSPQGTLGRTRARGCSCGGRCACLPLATAGNRFVSPSGRRCRHSLSLVLPLLFGAAARAVTFSDWPRKQTGRFDWPRRPRIRKRI